MLSNLQKGYLFNSLSVLTMAVGPLLSKFGLLAISPSKAAVLNTLTILAASWLWGRVTGKRARFYRDRQMLGLAACNAFGVIFMFLSMNLLSPVQVGFLGRFYTVFAVLLSVWLLGERMTKAEVALIVLAIGGAFLFVDQGGSSGTALWGTLFAVLYTFFFALTNIFIKKTLSSDRDSNSILFTNNALALGLVLAYGLLFGDLGDGGYSVQGVALVMGSSVLSGFAGTVLLYEALKYLRFSIANVTRALSPVLLAAVSYPFFPVALSVLNLLGAVLLVGSILLLSLAERQKAKAAPSDPAVTKL